MPLFVHGVPHRLLPLARELRFATDPVADYAGVLCAAGAECDAVPALAQAISAIGWDRAVLCDVRDERMGRVLARLSELGIALETGSDHTCYAFDLPDTYEAFLARLSYGTRRRTVRPMKVLAEKLPGFRVTAASPKDAAAHVDAVIALNTARWQGTALRARRLRALLCAAFEAGCLRVHVLWDGDRPIAGGAAFVDEIHGTYGFYLVGHDGDYEEYGPGKAVLDVLVREAIAGGFRTFDFLRGEDEYKKSYATQSTPIRSYVAVRHPGRETLLHAVEPAYRAVRAMALRFAERSTAR